MIDITNLNVKIEQAAHNLVKVENELQTLKSEECSFRPFVGKFAKSRMKEAAIDFYRELLDSIDNVNLEYLQRIQQLNTLKEHKARTKDEIDTWEIDIINGITYYFEPVGFSIVVNDQESE